MKKSRKIGKQKNTYKQKKPMLGWGGGGSQSWISPLRYDTLACILENTV